MSGDTLDKVLSAVNAFAAANSAAEQPFVDAHCTGLRKNGGNRLKLARWQRDGDNIAWGGLNPWRGQPTACVSGFARLGSFHGAASTAIVKATGTSGVAAAKTAWLCSALWRFGFLEPRTLAQAMIANAKTSTTPDLGSRGRIFLVRGDGARVPD